MNEMDKIIKYFKDNFKNIKDIYLDISNNLLVQNKCEIYLVVPPHKDNAFKWMLRIALKPTFDRWANSTVIEGFFDNENEIINYLENNQLSIYKQLLEEACDDLEGVY